MARPTSSSPQDLHAAALADATATDMAGAAQALARAGDSETAEVLRTMARHNRIVALKLRAMQGLTQDRMGLARIF
ncbi:hypothetical protein [Methylobacterium sp. E-066]|uniref:hypothetical protein n=1 Tax=Methylobacterium sp. E-066 TaxID=2836584 RepID=UPI001FBBC077|nr:hypothetical protein [Methylobacterium sp. E-066]MCJ2143796.1 hypothetical protein [Methylobacterium sp. E-066]